MDAWIAKKSLPSALNNQPSAPADIQTSIPDTPSTSICQRQTYDPNDLTLVAITIQQKNDIGFYTEKKCTDEEKYYLLKNRWLPKESHVFPASEHRNLKFQRKWLLNFPWLTYSEKFNGAFCQYCAFFATNQVGKGGHESTRNFVNRPFNRWQHAIEQFQSHQNSEYHKYAIVAAQNFIDTHEDKSRNVVFQLDSAKKIQIERNRKMFSSIVETILFIGRQEISCRGHRDAGPISTEIPVENDGNFRSLLRFRMSSGDDLLQSHLKESSYAYTSPKIQNELIEICGQIIRGKVVDKVNRAQGFSILADETTDISGIEQFSLCVRYIDEVDDTLTLREDFLKFVPVDDVTGKGLSEAIINNCNELGIDLNYLRGQGYDGARTMSGEFRGCATRILQQYPNAIYVHCANHSLNLAVGDVCGTPVIRNSLGTMNEIIGFFRNSAQRQTYLNESVSELRNDVQKKRLMRYCETRWVERLEAIVTFNEFFSKRLETLNLPKKASHFNKLSGMVILL